MEDYALPSRMTTDRSVRKGRRKNHPPRTKTGTCQVKMSSFRCQWGQQWLSYQAIHECNSLPMSTRNSHTVALIYLRRLCKQFYLILIFYLGFHCNCMLFNFFLTIFSYMSELYIYNFYSGPAWKPPKGEVASWLAKDVSSYYYYYLTVNLNDG